MVQQSIIVFLSARPRTQV